MRELQNWMETSVAQVKALKDDIIFFLQDVTFSPINSDLNTKALIRRLTKKKNSWTGRLIGRINSGLFCNHSYRSSNGSLKESTSLLSFYYHDTSKNKTKYEKLFFVFIFHEAMSFRAWMVETYQQILQYLGRVPKDMEKLTSKLKTLHAIAAERAKRMALVS